MRMRPEIHIAVDWAVRCFGFPHTKDKKTRALRIVEEAIELAQAVDVPREQIDKLVSYVYSRERDRDVTRELGGVLMTAYIMAAATFNDDPDRIFLRELRRVLDKPVEEFTRRNQEKVDAGFVAMTERA